MKKELERENPDSCWNNALDGERVFVLLARDVAAPDTIRKWARLRIALGASTPESPEIVEAMECAELMETERAGIRSVLGKWPR